MHRRVRAAVLVVLLTTLLAGCSTAVTAPATVAVDSTDEFVVEDTRVWTSGTTTEYKSAVVVTGTLRSTVDANTSVPEVTVRFSLASGETQTVDAVYELDRRQTEYEDLENATISPDDAVQIRAVFNPAGGVTVQNATIVVAS